MAEFVFGRRAAEKTEYILKKMRDRLSSGKKVIIIVPEQQALFWDTVTADRLPETDALNIETVSFTRLADNVFRKYGGTACRYVTDAEKTLLMWNAIFSCADRMEAFRSLDREDRYVSQLLGTVNELKMYSVTPTDLISAAERLDTTGTLPARLRDLALIYSSYETLLYASFEDPLDIPDALCDVLAGSDYFDGCSIFIDSFYTLTPKEMKIVSEIFRLTDDVTVTFAVSREDRNDDSAAFVWEYVKDMVSALSKCKKSAEICDIDADMVPEIRCISENLWNYSAEPFPEKTDRITVVKCSDRYDEAYIAAAKIRKLVLSGASYSDIAVVAADMSALRGITDKELERFGLPVYISGKSPLTSQPAFKLIVSALTVIGGGWRRDDIVSFAKTGVCGISAEECDALEKYTEIWNINGKKLYCGDDWDMNPDGYTGSVSDWGCELRSLANSARKAIIPPLEDLSSAFSGNITDACRAIYRLLCAFDVYGQLTDSVGKLEADGDISAAQEKSQVWGAVCSLLDTAASTVPDAAAEPNRLSALFRKIADTVSIGTIPDGIDRVILGSVSGMRLDGYRHIIVLGASAGEFPSVPRDTGFFSDTDRILMKSVGITLAPTSDKKLSEELFRFKYTVSAPSESLTLIIPSSGGICRPSVGASAIMRLFPGRRELDFTSKEGERAVSRFSGMGDSILDFPLSADREKIDPDFAGKHFGDTITVSQSRIETFNDCPFKYYSTYELSLDEGRTAELNPADIGTFVHAVLENFMREAAQDDVFPIPEDKIAERCDRLINEYLESICPSSLISRRDWLFRRVKNSINLYAHSLSDEFAQARFRPYEFELSIGYSDFLPTKAIPLSDGAVMKFRGKIDRVDILRENGKVYLRVVDYKTGSKNFSKTDVMKGRNVQLLLYLFSISDCPDNCGFRMQIAPANEEIVPAGALYFSARPGETSSSTVLNGDESALLAKNDVKRKGIVLSDKSIITAMDRDISGMYAPAVLTKTGDYNKRSSSVESIAGFREIEDAMNQSLRDIGDRLCRGTAQSSPENHGNKSPCTYCRMKAFCRHRDEKYDDYEDEVEAAERKEENDD